MIRESKIHQCPHCASPQIVKNGDTPKGKQQYRCQNCGKTGVLNPKVRYTEEQKEQILSAYFERRSMRGIERILGVARETLAVWLKKSREQPAHHRDTLPRRTRRYARTR